MKKIHSKGLFILLFVLLSYKGFSQLSTIHYIPPMTDSDAISSRVADHHMYLSTPNNTNVTYWVYAPNNLTMPLFTNENTSTELSKNTPISISLGTGYSPPVPPGAAIGSGLLFIHKTQTSVVTTGKGYIVKASAPIYVSIRFNSNNNNQAGALVSKGENALGTDFRVGAFNSNGSRSSYMNFFSVMATEDGTMLRFPGLRPHQNSNFGINYAGNDPDGIIAARSAILNKGQSIIIALSSNNALIGQRIISTDPNKPVVISCGSTVGSFDGPNSNRNDYGVDQIVDASKTGTEYIFVKGNGLVEFERVLLIAANGDPNTTVRLNGGPPIPIYNGGTNATNPRLNRNRFWNIYGASNQDLFINGALHIETSSPVFAYQGIGGSNNAGNKGLFFVPPLSCEARGNVENIPLINEIGNKTFKGSISIVTQNDATISVTSSSVGDLSSNLVGPTPVFGNTDYVVYKLTDPATGNVLLDGNISVFSDRELYCSFYNFNGVATAGSFYAGFPNAPAFNFDNPHPLLGTCFPNTTIEIENPEVFDRYKWYIDDGSGSGFQEITVADDTQPSYTPDAIGTYRVDGIIECSRNAGLPTTIPSEAFVIAACPTDTDSDGVPDTIDIDDDNDSITDAEEPGDSDGDGVINSLDLDSDNDGIYDIQESGRNLPDTDFDGRTDNITNVGDNGLDNTLEATPDSGIDVVTYPLSDTNTDTTFDFISLDSDGDSCNDVTEAGFTDNNDNGLLGDTPTSTDVDSNGKVTTTVDGYTIPTNSDYVNAANITISSQPEDTSAFSNESTSISVTSNADIVQWQLSTDSGTSWLDINDDSIYNGSTTSILNIINAPIDFDTYQYRALLNINGNSCEMINTSEITLTVTPSTLTYSGFSPNNDGKNDTYPLTNLKRQYPNFKITIFNRWGRPVFNGNIGTDDWNGKKDNNGELVPVGIYYYVVQFNQDDRKPEKGEIYVSR